MKMVTKMKGASREVGILPTHVLSVQDGGGPPDHTVLQLPPSILSSWQAWYSSFWASCPDRTHHQGGACGRVPSGERPPSRVLRRQHRTTLRNHHLMGPTLASGSKRACFSPRNRHGVHLKQVGRCPTRGELPRDGGVTAWPCMKQKRDTCRWQ